MSIRPSDFFFVHIGNQPFSLCVTTTTGLLPVSYSGTLWVDLFDSARSNYVVTNYHTELLQLIIPLELANLNISDYSITFDESCSSLEIKCYRLVYIKSF